MSEEQKADAGAMKDGELEQRSGAEAQHALQPGHNLPRPVTIQPANAAENGAATPVSQIRAADIAMQNLLQASKKEHKTRRPGKTHFIASDPSDIKTQNLPMVTKPELAPPSRTQPVPSPYTEGKQQPISGEKGLPAPSLTKQPEQSIAAIDNRPLSEIDTRLLPAPHVHKNAGQSAASNPDAHTINRKNITTRPAAPERQLHTPPPRKGAAPKVILPDAEKKAGYTPIEELIAIKQGRKKARQRLLGLILACCCVLMLIGGSIVGYVQLHEVKNGLFQVDAISGETQWYQPFTGIVQGKQVDGQGSIVSITQGNEHQLLAYDQHGNILWKGPQINGHLTIVPLPGRDTVALGSGQQNDLSLSLLNRNTGQQLWKSVIVPPGQSLQSAVIGGSDRHFIYVIKTTAPSSVAQGAGAKVQLLAVSIQTGAIIWHISAPLELNGTPHDDGQLLIASQHIIWQVEGMVYALQLPTGKVLWSKLIEGDNIGRLPQEEAQMTEASGLLLLIRATTLHALDLASGKERWNISTIDTDAELAPAHIAVSNNTLLIYGNGQISAFDLLTQHAIWSQKQLDSIQYVHPSEDGKLVYIVLTDTIEGGAPGQALVALDIQTGAARWTFEPTDPTLFLHATSDGISYQHNLILVTTCLPTPQKTCTRANLYAVNATTGETQWRFIGNSIDNMQLSSDGRTVLFQSNTDGWIQLEGQLRG